MDLETKDWHLSIDETTFDAIYWGLNIDKEVFRSKPKDEAEFRYSSQSKLWRLNNWYKVIDKKGDKVWFVMNLAQHKVYARQLRHGRSIILKSRQRGISTFFLINYFDDAITLPDLMVGMQSYGLEESAALLEKLTVAWDELSQFNKSLLEVHVVKNNTKAMGFSNGSMVKVATSFRGNTLHRLHVSELGKIANKDPKKARELKNGTLQAIKAGNPVAIESTAEGQHNAFHEWWYVAVDMIGEKSLKDFDPVFLSWVDDSDCVLYTPQMISDEDADEIAKIEGEWSEYMGLDEFELTDPQKWWFVASRRELDADFYQEYPHTPEAAFNAVHDGAYYARLWRDSGHIWGLSESKASGRERLFEPALAVHTAWDLGVNDMMCIVMFQVHGKELRLINEYHSHGEGLEHYVNKINDIAKKNGYNLGTHVLPHDANVFEMGASMTRKARLRELGMRRFKVLRRTKSVNTDIEQVRKAIPHMWLDPQTCGYLLKMWGRYSKKWDDMLGTFKDNPFHDEWSNPADSVRYMVMARLHKDAGSVISSSVSEGSGRQLKSNVVGGMAM